MGIEAKKELSAEGKAFLSDPLMFELLSPITALVGVTPEEYLLRFESVLADTPESIINIFENNENLF